jgi:thioredoxin 1
MVNEIKTRELFKKIIGSGDKVLIDFYGTFCGPCKKIAPLLNNFEIQYNDIQFYKVNIENPDLSDIVEFFEIEYLPTFVFAKNNSLITKIVGANIKDLEQAIIKFDAM